MGTFWNQDRIEKYEAATSLLHYPEIPLKEYFQEIIHPDDTILEIGSGPGVVSLYLASMCKQLVAVDNDKEACEHLRKRAEETGLKNIEVVNDEWPNDKLNPADVTVSLYVGNIYHTIDRVRELLRLTKRTGIMMVTQPGIKGGFPLPLSQQLGIQLKENAADDGSHTMELLESEGVKVRCETVKHEFGQPVESIEEAARFMMRQLRLDETYYQKVLESTEDLLETREGRLYVPFERTNNVIIFEK